MDTKKRGRRLLILLLKEDISMGMWWIYIVYVIFVYLMIKNIVVYKNQKKDYLRHS